MHPELLAKALSGMRCHNTTNIDEFMISSSIPSKRVAKEVLQYLRLRKVGTIPKGK